MEVIMTVLKRSLLALLLAALIVPAQAQAFSWQVVYAVAQQGVNWLRTCDSREISLGIMVGGAIGVGTAYWLSKKQAKKLPNEFDREREIEKERQNKEISTMFSDFENSVPESLQSQSKDLKDTILNNPKKFLQEKKRLTAHRLLEDQVRNAIKEQEKIIENDSFVFQDNSRNDICYDRRNDIFLQKHIACMSYIIKEIKSQENDNPLYLLNECFCPDFDRRDKPQLRATFDAEVAQALIEQAQMRDGVVHYTNVGSGALFQDCCILTQAMEKYDFKKIVINLIEPEYSDYLILQQKIQIGVCEDINPNIDQYIKSMVIAGTIKELKQWLKYNFPTVDVQIRIYLNQNSYIAESKNSSLKSDIIMCSDFGLNGPGVWSSYKALLKAKTLSEQGYGFVLSPIFLEPINIFKEVGKRGLESYKKKKSELHIHSEPTIFKYTTNQTLQPDNGYQRGGEKNFSIKNYANWYKKIK